MDYEKKYKEALERAKRLHGEPTGGTERIVCEQIFPELKESEDEKVRKAIISCCIDHGHKYGCFGVTMEDMCAWLDELIINYHLWTIQDANDGDVLVDSYSKDSIIILYKGINKERSILAHCGWNGYNFTVKTNGLGYGGLDNTNYLPATKEQRDLFFEKMKEAGYEWDSDKKELKKVEPKMLDPDKVIEWLKFESKAGWIIEIEDVINHFKKDFEI